MKYAAIFFVTLAAAATIVCSDPVYDLDERQPCDSRKGTSLSQFRSCVVQLRLTSSACTENICNCCSDILRTGDTSANTYTCCTRVRDFLNVCRTETAVENIPNDLRNCNLGSGATAVVPCFTGGLLLMILTALILQLLF